VSIVPPQGCNDLKTRKQEKNKNKKWRKKILKWKTKSQTKNVVFFRAEHILRLMEKNLASEMFFFFKIIKFHNRMIFKFCRGVMAKKQTSFSK